MAPWNKADGPLSRFTCETCHFEGYVDGRTRHTGRGDVRATTKPLLGLFNNRPHFSRALDPDLTAVADNEFRVAGALSGHDPWFSISSEGAPWLADLGLADAGRAARTPEALRRALMSFLMAFSYRANPRRPRPHELHPARARRRPGVQDRCARCHAPVLRSDDPGSAAPFERWEALVLAPRGRDRVGEGRIREDRRRAVRARGRRAGTVAPAALQEAALLHERLREDAARGARSGCASRTRAAARPATGAARPPPSCAGRLLHDGAPTGEGLVALDAGAIEALLAFLDLL